MNPLGPVVVPRSLTQDVSFRGGSRRDTLTADMTRQGVADILNYARFIFETDVDQQVKLRNPPSQIIVDGREGKPLDAMQRRAVAVFGTIGAPLLMRALENVLMEAIAKTTQSRTGKLSSLANWQWFLNRRPIAGPGAITQFRRTDTLTFAPTRVTKSGGGYATVANQKAASRGGLSVKRRISKKNRVEGGPTHRTDAVGFMGFTARKMRQMTAFRQYAISVQWDRTSAFGPNLGNQGMAFFMIRAKRTRGGGR